MDDRQKNKEVVVTLDSFPKKPGKIECQAFCKVGIADFSMIDGFIQFDSTSTSFRKLVHELLFHIYRRSDKNNWSIESITMECVYDD